MANEIAATSRLSFSKGGASASFDKTVRVTMSGDDYVSATQVIGTSAELVSLGDITSAPAFIAIKNLDATNFVTFGGDSGLTVFSLKLLPGESMLIRPTSATLYALADTAAVRIEILAIEA